MNKIKKIALAALISGSVATTAQADVWDYMPEFFGGRPNTEANTNNNQDGKRLDLVDMMEDTYFGNGSHDALFTFNGVSTKVWYESDATQQGFEKMITFEGQRQARKNGVAPSNAVEVKIGLEMLSASELLLMDAKTNKDNPYHTAVTAAINAGQNDFYGFLAKQVVDVARGLQRYQDHCERGYDVDLRINENELYKFIDQNGWFGDKGVTRSDFKKIKDYLTK